MAISRGGVAFYLYLPLRALSVTHNLYNPSS
jgi:hypothetical protein